ncbi:sperm-associated antigen 16 protein isoform X2 [Monodelphis domestica]|uniref:sperm-associated antigen 16 protein isoform X2 n=1 Tax=Monodelphis domestica TaxID=13616 RepID=UPI0024E1B676|nr:sperm-associated antigen 16 protein isoform X2 [Monodelphis domestica]
MKRTLSGPRPLDVGQGSVLMGAEETAEAVASEGAYYLEQVTITEPSETDYQYEEVSEQDDLSIPEGDEDLTKALEMAQEKSMDCKLLASKVAIPPKQSLAEVPEVVEDFLCNFLIKMGMTRTLNCFQNEWYESIQKGTFVPPEATFVPDVYTQNLLLDSENKNLKKDLKHYKEAAELKLHYASYEPTIRVLHDRHHILLRQKMLTSLERDKAVGQITGLQTTLRNLETGHTLQVPEIRVGHRCERDDKPEGPTQKALREAREQAKPKTKMKSSTKDSEFPVNIQPNPNLYFYKEIVTPPKTEYKLSNIFRLHELPVSCVAIHPRKEILISCSEDHHWKMVGIPKGNVILTGCGHTDWLSGCCFHPSGTKLATSSGDTTVKLWDLVKGDCILTLGGHSHAVWSCTWHSCGDFVASSSLDTTGKVWDVNSERCRYTLRGHTDSVNSIEFFPFSNTLLTSSADKSLSIWDARMGCCAQSLYGHMHSINDATFTARGHMIASCDTCGVTKIWDFRKLLPMVSIDIGPSPGNEVAFDSSGRVLAQASGNGVIHLLDLKSGQIRKLMGHESEAHSVVFSHNGEILFSGGADGTVRTWS